MPSCLFPDPRLHPDMVRSRPGNGTYLHDLPEPVYAARVVGLCEALGKCLVGSRRGVGDGAQPGRDQNPYTGDLRGLVAALLVWIVVLVVGGERPLWQVLLGAALTVALVLARENMALVPPVLFLYIFWQHGWRAGLLAMLCAGILFLLGNAFYFPDNANSGRCASRIRSPSYSPGRCLRSERPVSPSRKVRSIQDDPVFLADVQAAFCCAGQRAGSLAAVALSDRRPLSDRMRAVIF